MEDSYKLGTKMICKWNKFTGVITAKESRLGTLTNRASKILYVTLKNPEGKEMEFQANELKFL